MREKIPEVLALPEAEQRPAYEAIMIAAIKDPRMWGSLVAQGAGYVLIFFVFFPNMPNRMVYFTAYLITTFIAVKAIRRRVIREHVEVFFARKAEA